MVHAHIEKVLPQGDCEHVSTAILTNKYYLYSRTKEVKVILFVESHVNTPCNLVENGPLLINDLLTCYYGPREFLSAVYCLGYGENDAMMNHCRDNKRTPQFWKLLAACAEG